MFFSGEDEVSTREERMNRATPVHEDTALESAMDQIQSSSQKQSMSMEEKVVSGEAVSVSGENPQNVLDLPSKGKLGYPSSVQYREVLVKDEEKLSNATGKTYLRTLNAVLKDISGSPEWFSDMCVHDRDFFLIWVWSNTYSPTKEIEWDCPSCSKKNNSTIDFTKEPVSDIHSQFKGYFDMDLKCGEKIRVRLNTVKDELDSEVYLANNTDIRFEHLMLVKSIETSVTIPTHKMIKWVNENITGREMAKIKEFHVKLQFGFKPTVELACEGCGEVTHDRFPWGIEDLVSPTVQTDINEFL